MAKISDFGNTWAKFFCRGETHAVHLARHPSPLHGKNRAKWHHLRKIFSARGSSSSFSPFTLKCPNSRFLETTFDFFAEAVSSVVFRGCYPHTGSSPFVCPSISTWRKSATLETLTDDFELFSARALSLSADTPRPLMGKSHQMTPVIGNFLYNPIQRVFFWCT